MSVKGGAGAEMPLLVNRLFVLPFYINNTRGRCFVTFLLDFLRKKQKYGYSGLFREGNNDWLLRAKIMKIYI